MQAEQIAELIDNLKLAIGNRKDRLPAGPAAAVYTRIMKLPVPSL